MANEGLISSNCPSCGSTFIHWDEEIHMYRCNNCNSALLKNIKTNQILLTNAKICEKCGESNALENKFCAQCSEPLLVSCPNCGKFIDSKAKYCPECKVHIKEAVLKERDRGYQTKIDELKKMIAEFGQKLEQFEKQRRNIEINIDEVRVGARRIYPFGGLFLNSEKKRIYRQFNAELGCIGRNILHILGVTLAFAFIYVYFTFLTGSPLDTLNFIGVYDQALSSGDFLGLAVGVVGSVILANTIMLIIEALLRIPLTRQINKSNFDRLSNMENQIRDVEEEKAEAIATLELTMNEYQAFQKKSGIKKKLS